ncbi:speriolin [Rhea pennata]|uniref:speriolin n=1 Tax=Rhea pennata TaxID=8795 RepID=UPI002E261885
MQALPRVPSSSTGQAVFTCYDQLRREIQALLAENEELKRVVDLIKENQHLRELIRSCPDMMPNLPPIFTPTPRPDGTRSNFFSLANTSDWGSELAEQDVSVGPVVASSPLDSNFSGASLLPITRRRTFAGHFAASPSQENYPQRFSCPLDRFSPRGRPADTLPPAEQPLPEPPLDLQALEQSPRRGRPPDLQAAGARFSLPAQLEPRAPEQLPEPLLQSAPAAMPAAPLSPIPLPPAPGPPEQPLPLEPRTPEQPMSVQRPPDVRPKEYPRKIARAADRPASIRESARPGSRDSPQSHAAASASPANQPCKWGRKKKGQRKRVSCTGRCLGAVAELVPYGRAAGPTASPGNPAAAPAYPKQQMWERIVGEIAFQLDRRILSSIFPDRVRLYGFTVSNIPEKIMMSVFNSSQAGFDERSCAAMTQRYVTLMNRLKALGYSPEMHPAFTESIVNTYGILRERPELTGPDTRSYNSPGFLRRVVLETVPLALQPDVLLLLECLQELAQEDGKPLFIW